MDILQLRYFISAAEMQSMSKAAQAYGIPQPSMSQTISRFEKEVGVKLFDRLGNRVILNEDGEIMYTSARTALEAISDGMARVTKQKQLNDTNITIVIDNHREVVVNTMAAFAKEYPETSFTVHHHLFDGDKQNLFDLCVSTRILDAEKYESRLLAVSPLKLVVYPGMELYNYNGIVTPEMIRNIPMILPRTSGDVWRRINTYFNNNGMTPNVKLVCEEIAYMDRYMQMGLGVTIIPDHFKDSLSDNLKLLPLQYDPILEQYTYLYWKRANYQPNYISILRDSIIDAFQKITISESQYGLLKRHHG